MFLFQLKVKVKLEKPANGVVVVKRADVANADLNWKL